MVVATPSKKQTLHYAYHNKKPIKPLAYKLGISLHQENPQHLCLTHEDLHAACGEKSHEPKYLKIPRLPKPHEPHKHINSKSTQIQQDS